MNRRKLTGSEMKHYKRLRLNSKATAWQRRNRKLMQRAKKLLKRVVTGSKRF